MVKSTQKCGYIFPFKTVQIGYLSLYDTSVYYLKKAGLIYLN